jgi:tetratricopeptide (TPR) repeat protein
MTNLFSEPEAVKTTQHHFEDAIAKDPRFALSYSGLADSYAYLAFFRQLPPESAVRSAEAAIQKALELDDSIGEAHDTLAVLRWRYDWDWGGAEQEFNHAIALAPSYSCSHEDLANFFSFTGRRIEALAEVAKSFELDPGPTQGLSKRGFITSCGILTVCLRSAEKE